MRKLWRRLIRQTRRGVVVILVQAEAAESSMVPYGYLGAEIIEEETQYWKGVRRYIGFGLVAYGVLTGLVFLVTPRNAEDMYFRNDISGPSALGGFAILATVIVALQIAVRTPIAGNQPELASILARQRGLESIAMLSGMAAIAIGFAAAFRFQGMPNLMDLPRVLGPIAGGLLLAALAADASSASDRLSGKEIQIARRRLELANLMQILEREDSRARRSAVAGRLQVVAGLVLFPIAFSSLLQLAWPTDLVGAVVRALGVLTYVVLLSGIAGASWHYFLIGDRLSLSAFVAMMVAVVVLLLDWLLFDQPSQGYEDGQSLIFSVIWALVAVMTPLVLALSACTGWIPSKFRGIGEERVLNGLRKRAVELDLPQRPTRVSITPWAVISLVVPFPPAGVWLAHKALARARRAGDGKGKGLALACLVIGYVWISVLVACAAILVIANPSFM